MAAELGVWRWDLVSGQVQLSERLRGMYGIHPSKRVGTMEEFITIVHPDDRAAVLGHLERALNEREPFSFQTRIHRFDNGQERTVIYRGSPQEGSGDEVEELVGVCQDITSRVTAETLVTQLERRLADIIEKSPSLITIKDLNHRYLLANNDVADIAGRPLEQLIGRTATEIFPEVGAAIDAQAAEAVATLETIHSDVTIDVRGQNRTFHLVSFALTDDDRIPVEVCCIATDVTDSRQRQEETRLRQEVSELIGSAIADDRLVAVRQPVVRISDSATVSEELLIRLSLPDGSGLLQPASFLPMAERFNLIQKVDIWMVQRALALSSTRPAQVNLSAVTFSDRGARDAILSALRREPEAAPRVIFEITETAAAHHLGAAEEFAAALTELGCGLALDDFGTGFGSFTYLRRLPLRYLKIDRSFVTGLANSPDDRRVVSSIIGIAKQFELWTIAEGVEDARTLEILAELGADFAQGFYLGRPRPV